MRRWNGWGDESNMMDLAASGKRMIEGFIGSGTPLSLSLIHI